MWTLQAENIQNVCQLQSKHLRFGVHKSWNFVQNFLRKPWKRRTSKMRLNFMANSFALDTKNVRMHPEMFYKACTEKTSKMRLNFTANTFVFRRINREISPILFSISLASEEVPKCVWTSRQTASFLDALIMKLCQEIFHKAYMEKTSKISQTSQETASF